MDERLMFESTLQHNAARISDVASRWMRGLSAEDKDALLADAVDIAWHRREQLDPRRTSIGEWFAECMGQAARRRKVWRVWRAGEYRWVAAHHLEEWR